MNQKICFIKVGISLDKLKPYTSLGFGILNNVRLNNKLLNQWIWEGPSRWEANKVIILMMISKLMSIHQNNNQVNIQVKCYQI